MKLDEEFAADVDDSLQDWVENEYADRLAARAAASVAHLSSDRVSYSVVMGRATKIQKKLTWGKSVLL